MAEIEYRLRIYIPGSFDDVWQDFVSTTPFMPIHIGEMLNPAQYSHSKSYPPKLLRVTEIEHTLWELQDKVTHGVRVYSEEVEGGREPQST